MGDGDRTFWIVEGGELREYVRRGECCKCGDCCNGFGIRAEFHAVPVNVGHDGDESEDWTGWEGWSIHLRYGLWWWWLTETAGEGRVCESWSADGCEIWGTDRYPPLCRDWPVHPRDLERFPSCSFWFELFVVLWSGGTIHIAKNGGYWLLRSTMIETHGGSLIEDGGGAGAIWETKRSYG